jgi:hypothetical protein
VACVPCRTRNEISSVGVFYKHWRLLLTGEKLNREFDIIKIIRAVRDFQVIKHCTLEPVDKLLLNF